MLFSGMTYFNFKSMMKNLIIGLFLLLSSQAAVAQSSYKVTFENKSNNANLNVKTVYLFSIEDKMAIDSAQCVNGVYTMAGKAALPKLASVCASANGYNVIAAFVLDDKEINVTVDSAIRVKGSEVNDNMQSITKAIEDGGRAQRELQMKAAQYNGQIPDSVAKALDAEWMAISDRQMKALKDGIIANKDNLIPVYFIFNYMEVLGTDFIDNFLKDYKYKDDVLLTNVYKMIEGEKRKAQGVAFMDFEQPDMDGNMHKLSEYAGKGNYVLVDFWASWCGPCRKEMPNLKKVYDSFHSKGFEIVGVSLDNNKKSWTDAVENMQMTWPQLSDLKAWKNSAAQLYYIKSIPATLLIGPDGKIVASNLRGQELEKKLEEIFK